MNDHPTKEEGQEEILPPVDRERLQEELGREKLLRTTNNAHNEIYVVDAHDSPHLMKEVGRLRELSFRMAGGGTGKAVDIDPFDTALPPYKQLIVWDPSSREIVGGYRYIVCPEARRDEQGLPALATSELFRFSPAFVRDYLPYTIELGRSFVQPAYQPSRENRKSIYSLDNLWDGLGALVVDHPGIRYFFGKVTMYTHYNVFARDMILYFLNRFFPDPDRLVEPHKPLGLNTPVEKLERLFRGDDYEGNYRSLLRHVREQKENIPPLINSYMGLSPSMRTFGTAINEHFGGVEETAILLTIGDIYAAKKERHINTYRTNPIRFNLK
jgi:hypothetical protein